MERESGFTPEKVEGKQRLNNFEYFKESDGIASYEVTQQQYLQLEGKEITKDQLKKPKEISERLKASAVNALEFHKKEQPYISEEMLNRIEAMTVEDQEAFIRGVLDFRFLAQLRKYLRNFMDHRLSSEKEITPHYQKIFEGMLYRALEDDAVIAKTLESDYKFAEEFEEAGYKVFDLIKDVEDKVAKENTEKGLLLHRLIQQREAKRKYDEAQRAF